MSKKVLYIIILSVTALTSFFLFFLLIAIAKIPQNISILMTIIFTATTFISGISTAFVAIELSDKAMQELENLSQENQDELLWWKK